MSTRQLRWRGGVAAAVVLATTGIIVPSGTLVLSAIIPLIYVTINSLSGIEPVDGLVASRQIHPHPARPGEAVTVTLSVTNDSDRTLPDVRIADGVPDELAVVDGSPRAADSLEPDEKLTVSYRLVARRGEYEFDAPEVRTRGLGAGSLATDEPDLRGAATLLCKLDADAPPLEEYGDGRVGTLTTDDPGEGLSFHSVREHRPDDPASRIDWRHYAKRGELTTIDYERHVPATVVLVLDARAANFVVESDGRPPAVELQAYAATRALTDLLGSGQDVGVAVIGLDGPGPEGLYWLPPGGGVEQRSLGLDMFRAATDASPEDVGDATDQILRLLDLLPAGGQLTLFSPLLDDDPVDAVETWCGANIPVSVLSPDVVPETTVSGQYEQTRRRTRLARCQSAGARVYDWRRGTPLVLVIEHAFATEARTSSTRATGGGV